jgi:hypothetical protein
MVTIALIDGRNRNLKESSLVPLMTAAEPKLPPHYESRRYKPAPPERRDLLAHRNVELGVPAHRPG